MRSSSRRLARRAGAAIVTATAMAVVAASCAGTESEITTLTAEMPLHLEEHLGSATVSGSAAPTDRDQPILWDFRDPQPDWRPVRYALRGTVGVETVPGALRITTTEENRSSEGRAATGTIAVDLPDLRLEDWPQVLVEARTETFANLYLALNEGEREHPGPVRRGEPMPMLFLSDGAPMIRDGALHTYRLDPRMIVARWGEWEGPWRQLLLHFSGPGPASADLLSVTLVSEAAMYADAPFGTRSTEINNVYRRSIFTHTPGRLAYRVRVPAGGRLDIGLGVLGGGGPVTFVVSATDEHGAAERLLQAVSDDGALRPASVDLAAYAGRTITLALETDSEEAGEVALWTAPTVTGNSAPADKPNVIFYVIDGGGADYMSLYGYNRRTTPNLERIAAEGAVFERAYSNSSWTRPSTASFMTSLQHGVLGGFRGGFNVIPEDAPTMAQHMHRAGYPTAVFTANPNAGRMSGLERGVDEFREDWAAFSYSAGTGDFKESSRHLHDAFWRWRDERPAQPYWAHFQTVDVHQEVPANAPFSGLFVDPEQVLKWREWDARLSELDGHGVHSESWEQTDISRVEFFTVHQGLHDENLAHNDYQLGRLVDRLKATGEWDNTLLIVGADHSVDAAMDDMGIATLDEPPLPGVAPIFRPSISRVPLVFVWPSRIPAGQRFAGPASMIDVLPTLLDLVGLPAPEVVQGQSLAPLLLGNGEIEHPPVIFDEFEVVPATGELRGRIEVVDGRWGASLQVNPEPDPHPFDRRPPVLLFDLLHDPWCLRSVHEEHLDLVEHYQALLQERLALHQALAQQFTAGEEVALTPEQLEALRALGYIQ